MAHRLGWGGGWLVRLRPATLEELYPSQLIQELDGYRDVEGMLTWGRSDLMPMP